MANRSLLHRNKFYQFKAWLENINFTILETKGGYEVLRAKSVTGKLVIIFDNDRSSEHLSVRNEDVTIVREFINSISTVVKEAKDEGNIVINYKNELDNIKSYREGFVQTKDWVKSIKAMEELVEQSKIEKSKVKTLSSKIAKIKELLFAVDEFNFVSHFEDVVKLLDSERNEEQKKLEE